MSEADDGRGDAARREDSEHERLLDAGEAVFGAGDFARARELFAAVTAADPGNGRAWNDLGAALHAEGAMTEAVDAFRTAVAIRPCDADALGNLAQALLALGDEDGAREAIARLQAAAPEDPLLAAVGGADVPMPLYPWIDLVVGRVLARDPAVAVEGPDGVRGALAARGAHVAAPGETAGVLVRIDPRSPAEWPGIVIDVRSPGGASLPPPAPGPRTLAFAAHPDGGFLGPDATGGREIDVRITFEDSGSGPTRVPDRIALFDWAKAAGGEHGALRRRLRDLGISVAEAPRRVVEALAPPRRAGAIPGLAAWLDLVRPPCALVEEEMPEAPAILAALGKRDIPAILLAARAPEPAAPGAGPLRLAADAGAAAIGAALRAASEADEGPGRADAAGVPPLSVIVPTYDRPACVRQLLDALAVQDLDPALFEVILVDDGSPKPAAAALDGLCFPYRLVIERQANGGPAKARNTALRHARGRWLVIFNDDAVPAPDNLSRHLIAQADSDRPVAILGTFSMPDAARAHPFVDLVESSSFIFDYVGMKPGALHDWRWFYTCNVSLPRDVVEKAGGFDEGFTQPIHEDVELGYRLMKHYGVMVRYDPRIRARHDHDMDVRRYARRGFLVGFWARRMWQKHPELKAQYLGRDLAADEGLWNERRRRVEMDEAAVARIVGRLETIEREDRTAFGTEERRRLLKSMTPLVEILRTHEYWRGQIAAGLGMGDHATRNPPDLGRALTSVIMPNLNGFPHLVAAIESLRAHTEGPFELIVADNGSTDGSLEWLRRQGDVRLLELGENLGAPAARNRALAEASGETILFCDNDVELTPGWREILLAHLARWPDVGVVGPMSHVVSGPQRTLEHRPIDEPLAAFARRFHAYHAGEHLYTWRLILFFMLVHRRVIEKIGGFDEGFGRWGFEDDDFCLRAHLAGFRLRNARDCYILHRGSQTSRTAAIDYKALLRENWEVFKLKWGLDPGLAFTTRLELKDFPPAAFDPRRHRIAIDRPTLATAGAR